MKKTFAILLVLLFATPALAQYGGNPGPGQPQPYLNSHLGGGNSINPNMPSSYLGSPGREIPRADPMPVYSQPPRSCK